MENKEKVIYKGISFTGLLGILFIALKLTGFIDWSWIWVLAPLWIGWAICALAVIGIGIWILIVIKKTDKEIVENEQKTAKRNKR